MNRSQVDRSMMRMVDGYIVQGDVMVTMQYADSCLLYD